MTANASGITAKDRVVVVGAGIAGLAAAARLAHEGLPVLLLDRQAAPGGKMRCLESPAGPVDAGPTVLTMRAVFDELFAEMGERLDDHVTLVRQRILARHFWPDGSRLDLFDTENDSAEAIRAFAGADAARQFRAFSERARTLFDGFERPVMRAPTPSLPGLTAHVLRNPHLIRPMAPMSTLASLLHGTFDDPRLAQLFGRYATYVGGSPYKVPGLLALIWKAEAAGVWVVQGGMHRLARAICDLAQARGAETRFDTHVERIERQAGRVSAVILTDGTRIATNTVIFNGDPRALATGALGSGCAAAAPQTKQAGRSLSAEVWAFAATPQGPELAHHNVFFRDDPKPEFDALDKGQLHPDPTLYICAQDRGLSDPVPSPERFEIIANAPPLDPANPRHQEFDTCRTRTFQTLARFGLSFDPIPGPDALTTPQGFDRLFPASLGSLYGQSPHGMTAAFQRPTARTAIPGLYLAGGGTHPGAGVPMATLSGRHAAAAILSDRTSTSTSQPTATHGGISTGSATTAPAPSASSRS